jgi:hypothetical protein
LERSVALWIDGLFDHVPLLARKCQVTGMRLWIFFNSLFVYLFGLFVWLFAHLPIYLFYLFQWQGQWVTSFSCQGKLVFFAVLEYYQEWSLELTQSILTGMNMSINIPVPHATLNTTQISILLVDCF